MKMIFSIILMLLLTTVSTAQETHIVQVNQTLYSIARLYNISVDQLMSWNQLQTFQIRSGQQLVVKPGLPKKNLGLIPFLYTVQKGDQLSSISLKFNTPVDELKKINDLNDEIIFPGQQLFIRKPVGISLYTVQSGDHLSMISLRFGIRLIDLKQINQLQDENIYPGQVLRVFKPKTIPLTHEVLPIDTLDKIAALYNLSSSEIKKINGLSSSKLYSGQTLRLRSYNSASKLPFLHHTSSPEEKVSPPSAQSSVSFPQEVILLEETYKVQKGDTLFRIAKNHNIPLKHLLDRNRLTQDSVIYQGQQLIIQPSQAQSSLDLTDLPYVKSPVSFPEQDLDQKQVQDNKQESLHKPKEAQPETEQSNENSLPIEQYIAIDPSISVFEWNNDYYYWSHPGEISQPSKGYFENKWISPLDAYRKAKILFKKFDSFIAQTPTLSQTLQGYTIVIDPGHGGLDPGVIVESSDSNNNTIYITEDEYVYDIALRMYALLKRHGAYVDLTLLAPNHLIRKTDPAHQTLINEKNEVYNDLLINQINSKEAWPQGSAKGLEKRVELIGKFFEKTPSGKRIFISLHADNNPNFPSGTGLYTLNARKGSKEFSSKSLAGAMLDFLGDKAYTRTADFVVLRDNIADFKILVEVENVAFENRSWAMCLGSSRQLYAEKLVQGLLNYFKN